MAGCHGRLRISPCRESHAQVGGRRGSGVDQSRRSHRQNFLQSPPTWRVSDCLPLTGLILRQQLPGIKDGDISKGEEEEESRQRREVGFLSGADKSSSRPSDRSRHTCSIFVYFKLPIQQQLRHVAHFASFFLFFLFLLTLFHLSSTGAASSSSPIAHVPFDPLLCCCCWPQSLEIR